MSYKVFGYIEDPLIIYLERSLRQRRSSTVHEQYYNEESSSIVESIQSKLKHPNGGEQRKKSTTGYSAIVDSVNSKLSKPDASERKSSFLELGNGNDSNNSKGKQRKASTCSQTNSVQFQEKFFPRRYSDQEQQQHQHQLKQKQQLQKPKQRSRSTSIIDFSGISKEFQTPSSQQKPRSRRSSVACRK